ncbi:F-box protein At3g07870-like [Andrographis paniculata]|uniref:F-box protein At3g07870-like n=1 Tax=Andrographis paniculata TaxID=175694 RepID=UPI0021E751D8|nr:F-box protein At3g07870-like [Andrographis paniculata]
MDLIRSNRETMFLMNLPSHLILEILSRLPAKTIIQCRCVCQLWLRLIDNHHFAAVNFSRARPGLVVHQSDLFKSFARLVDFDDDDSQDHLPRNTMLKFNLNAVSTFPDASIAIDGSVNGFLLLRDVNYAHETLYVCNPLNREYIVLPVARRSVRYPSVVTHGFGLTSAGNEYKIVRVFHERELDPITGSCLRIPFSECQVYSLNTGTWRTIGDAPFGYDSRSLGFFFQGNIHWLIQDFVGNELISCFDLENEVFHPFAPPFPGRKILGSLGNLKGCLCLCDNSSESVIEIWVMKEYGVENSWCKEIVVKKMPELVGPSFQIVHVFRVFRDGKILLLWGDFFMLYCCTKSGDAREVDMAQPSGPNSIEAMHYVPNFQSLGSIAGLETTVNSLF